MMVCAAHCCQADEGGFGMLKAEGMQFDPIGNDPCTTMLTAVIDPRTAEPGQPVLHIPAPFADMPLVCGVERPAVGEAPMG